MTTATMHPRGTAAARTAPATARRRPRIVIGLLTAATVLPWLPAAAGETREEPATTDVSASSLSHVGGILSQGKLVMTCFPDQVSPFIAVNTDRGPMKPVGTADDFRGIDVELMRRIAADLGVTLEVRPVTRPSYVSLLEMLTSGAADVVASGLTRTEKRQRDVDFSVPYVEFVQVIVAKAGAGPYDADALAGSRIALVEGSSMHDLVSRWGFRASQIDVVDFTQETYLAVTEGRTDIAIADSVSLEADLKDFKDLEPRFRMPEIQGLAYAVPRGSDLKGRIDAVLTRMRRDGSLARLLTRHLNNGADLSRLAGLPLVGDQRLASVRLDNPY